jgi:Domain of unknown function (DUF929)
VSKSARIRNEAVRAKIAAQQAAARRGEVRRRALIASGIVAVVAVVVVAIVVAAGRTPAPAKGSPAVGNPSLARAVTTVSPATLNAVGKGTAAGLRPLTGPSELMQGGKPEVLYMGGEFCPYCAAERWAIAAAVSRFGTLSGLRFIHSSPTDVFANTPTLTFDKASYSSRYLSFVPVEWYGEADDPSTPFGHVYLQHPTAAQQLLFRKYSGGSIPFLDIANRYLLPNTSYSPQALAGLTWAQVAADMHNPDSTVAKDIDGAVNIISAAICRVTAGQPGGVCHAAGVTAAAGSL